MASHTPSFVRNALLASAFCALVGVASAQTAALPLQQPAAQAAAGDAAPDASTESGPAEGGRNRKVERIHVEDSGARVDEVRYGGQTQSITVQPKANVPSYEVLPNDGGRERQGQTETGSGGNGPRVWNLMKF
ncbi:MAG: hypothetical protein ACRYGA_11000 [Janthinobacterium lividum]